MDGGVCSAAMRILHISTRLIIGGSQENTILSCVGHALNVTGRGPHEVHLAFGPIYGPEGSMLPRVEAFNREHVGTPIRTHVLPSMVREVSPLRDGRAIGEVAELVKAIEPDVVHTHSSKAGVVGRTAAWAAFGRGRSAGEHTAKPGVVVHTVHGPPFMPVEGSVVSRLKTRAKNRAYTAAERFAAKRCDRIYAVADAMTETFVSRNIGDAGMYETVRSGMETEAFLDALPAEERARRRGELGFGLGFGADDVVIGTVSRLAEHKGHDEILDAAAALVAEGRRVKLLWVGDGWWRERLERRARDLGLGECLVVTGMVAPSDVAGYLKLMDCLVHASAREGLPRVVPQALLSGVPVIATDADGTREIVEDGVTGWLVPVGDAGAIAGALRESMDDRERAARLAAEGRERARRMFDWEVMVEQLEASYASLLEQVRGGAS